MKNQMHHLSVHRPLLLPLTDMLRALRNIRNIWWHFCDNGVNWRVTAVQRSWTMWKNKNEGQQKIWIIKYECDEDATDTKSALLHVGAAQG